MEDLRQNKAWGKYLLTQNIRPVTIKARDGVHTMIGLVLPLRLFGLNMLKIQRSLYDPDWKDLSRVKKKYRIVSSIIEPQIVEDMSSYRKAGYRLSRFPYLSTKTVLVDLRQKVDILWSKLSDNAKRLVKKNHDLVLREVSPKAFLEEWKKWTKIMVLKEKQLLMIKKIMGKKARFIVGEKNGQMQSGVILLLTSDMANYFHTWTSSEGRRNGGHYKLVWEIFLQCKKEGYRYFDFEGIYDQRWPQKRWLGFTEFKKKFGGEIVDWPGCFFRWF